MKQTGRGAVREADHYNSMLLVPNMVGTESGHRLLPQVDFMTHRQRCATLVIMLLILAIKLHITTKGNSCNLARILN